LAGRASNQAFNLQLTRCTKGIQNAPPLDDGAISGDTVAS